MPNARRLLPALAPLALACALPGCFSYHRARGEALAPEPLPADAWPSFDTAPLTPLLETPKVMRDRDYDPSKIPPHLAAKGDAGQRAHEAAYTTDLRLLRMDDHGLLRVWSEGTGHGRTRRLRGTPRLFMAGILEDFQPNAAYLTAPELESENEWHQIRRSVGGIALPPVVPDPEAGADPDAWRLDTGIRMFVPTDTPPDPAGLVIHLTSLFENKYEHRVTERLEAHDFAVAFIDSDPYLHAPNETARRTRDAERDRRARELRAVYDAAHPTPTDLDVLLSREYTDGINAMIRQTYEQSKAEYPGVEDGFQVRPDTDIEWLATFIAHAADGRIAEHAYAAEALVRAADELNPAMAGKPVVVLAYSVGTVPGPAVAARLHEAFPGRPVRLVMVGGAGNLIAIARASWLGNGVLRLKSSDPPEPTEAQLDALSDAYMARTRLDPLKVAPALRDVPVLHVQADADTVMPTALGRAFNAAHAHTDTLVHHGDHDTLFFFVPQQAGRIRSWLREQGVE